MTTHNKNNKTCATCAKYITPNPRSSTQFEPQCCLGVCFKKWKNTGINNISEIVCDDVSPTFGCNRWEKRK